MAISATITSGRSFLAAVTRAGPSSTVATSSNSSASRFFNPSVTMRWSSASTTRGRFMIGLLYRYPGRHRRAIAGNAINVQFAVQQVNPLSHAGLPETGPAARLFTVETRPVVFDDELYSAIQAAK